MITEAHFLRLVEILGEQAVEDIAWAESIEPPTDPDAFALEAAFVICNSGMKNTIARRIFERVRSALIAGEDPAGAFGHTAKAAAISEIWRNRVQLLRDYQVAADQLAFLEALPWIGGITKFHLAKNFGLQVAKPDVHLQRLADLEGTTPQQLCEELAEATGFKVATVDTVLWRACANGILDGHTGEIRTSPPPADRDGGDQGALFL